MEGRQGQDATHQEFISIPNFGNFRLPDVADPFQCDTVLEVEMQKWCINSRSCPFHSRRKSVESAILRCKEYKA